MFFIFSIICYKFSMNCSPNLGELGCKIILSQIWPLDWSLATTHQKIILKVKSQSTMKTTQCITINLNHGIPSMWAIGYVKHFSTWRFWTCPNMSITEIGNKNNTKKLRFGWFWYFWVHMKVCGWFLTSPSASYGIPFTSDHILQFVEPNCHSRHSARGISHFK